MYMCGEGTDLGKGIKIAIDGPAGSGKSTIAKQLAKRLNLDYIDTGAMYRAITYEVIKKGVAPGDRQGIIDVAHEAEIRLEGRCVLLNGKDVTREIRAPSVDERVSEVASIPEVRKRLVAMQRRIAGLGGVIMDGRDIGTSVLPEAEFKFFLTAALDERAKRRYHDLLKENPHITLKQVKDEMERRDHLDSTRGYSPLRAADDANIIDTTGRRIQDVLNEITEIVGGKGDVL
jgi:cytidylate kinase